MPFPPKMRGLLLRPGQVILPIGEFVATGEILLLYLQKIEESHILLLYLPRIGESYSIAPLISSYSAVFLGMVSILLRPTRVIISIGEFVATGEILLLYLPRIWEFDHPFLFRHPSRNSDQYDTDILIHQSTVIIILLRLLKKRNASILRRLRILSLPPQLSNMNMLLLLMFPLPNVSLPISIEYPFLLPRNTNPATRPAAHHLIYILNRIARPPPCFTSILSVLLVHNGLWHFLQTYIHRFALTAVPKPKHPPIFFFLCDAYLLLTFACDPSQAFGITMGLL